MSVTTIGTSGTERLGQWLLYDFLAHRCWVSDYKRNFWWLCGWVRDYSWHSWHTNFGSVTPIDTSDTRRLGQWLLREVLANRRKVSGHCRLFWHTEFGSLTACYLSFGARRLCQWLLLVLRRAEAGSVTTIGISGTKNSGHWLLSAPLAHKSWVSDYYRNFWHTETRQFWHTSWISDCYWFFGAHRFFQWLPLVLWATEVCSVTTIGTSGTKRFGQWLLSALLAHKSWVSDYYRRFWHTETRSVINVGSFDTQAGSVTAIDLLGHIHFFSHYHWSPGPRRFTQWLLSEPLAHKGWVSDYYWHVWHTEKGSVVIIGICRSQRLEYWQLLVFFRT